MMKNPEGTKKHETSVKASRQPPAKSVEKRPKTTFKKNLAAPKAVVRSNKEFGSKYAKYALQKNIRAERLPMTSASASSDVTPTSGSSGMQERERRNAFTTSKSFDSMKSSFSHALATSHLSILHLFTMACCIIVVITAVSSFKFWRVFSEENANRVNESDVTEND